MAVARDDYKFLDKYWNTETVLSVWAKIKQKGASAITPYLQDALTSYNGELGQPLTATQTRIFGKLSSLLFSSRLMSTVGYDASVVLGDAIRDFYGARGSRTISPEQFN